MKGLNFGKKGTVRALNSAVGFSHAVYLCPSADVYFPVGFFKLFIPLTLIKAWAVPPDIFTEFENVAVKLVKGAVDRLLGSFFDLLGKQRGYIQNVLFGNDGLF